MRSLRLITLSLAAVVLRLACAASIPSPSHTAIFDPGAQKAAARTTSSTPAITPEPQPPDTFDGLAISKRETTAAARTVTVAAVLPSTAPEYSSYSLFTSAVLNSTNFFRRDHNATVATWNATLAKFADDYLANDTDCTFAHSGGPYGENLAVGYQSVHGAIDGWGNERREYNFKNPGFTEETGHFSQLVWKTSVTVGCGRRLCGGKAQGEKSTGWFLACEYWPRGNIIGQFAEEVQKQAAQATGGAGSGTGNSSNSGNNNAGSSPAAEEYGSRPSSGVIIGAMVVLFIITAAFIVDVRVNIQDRD
ncbi:scp-like extracellular protein [Ophiostoma piceae UAMH 11346]|uniref:Scp-like extracellular protein n=1 Tax=Ophiostoma piceae (strain UAMH 11346) TaxID=1262450 RepID=S3C5G0_OPHP1|nr:scp-like extracellular protein [Ophiostoma piceae UAMH 11346]